jgi:hypothetical protein
MSTIPESHACSGFDLVSRVLDHPHGGIQALIDLAGGTETDWLEFKAAMVGRHEDRKNSERPYGEAIQEVAEDIADLIARFDENEKMNERPSFLGLTRVFSEHCEVTQTEMAVVLPKASDENGQRARGMQNPSDLDAGYDGHKGPGYQVQISQAYGGAGEEGA